MLSGCTRIEEINPIFVSETIDERIGMDVEWNRISSSERIIDEMINCLLQAPLSVEDAVQIALLNNPNIQAAFEEIGLAHADFIEASLFSNPVYDAFFRIPDRKGLVLNTEFAITQSCLDFFLVPLRKKIASAGIKKADLHAANEILNLAFDVQETYYHLIAEQQRLHWMESLVELADAAFQLASEQREQGNINPLEIQQKLNDLLETKIELAQSQVEIVKLREQMNTLLGFSSPDICWSICDSLSPLPADEISTESLEALALSQRLDLEAAKWEVEQIARMNAVKQWWAYSHLAAGFAGEKDPGGAWTQGPAVSGAIPIFNYGQGERARLYAAYRQKLDRFDALKIVVTSEVRSARDQMMIHRSLALAYQNDVLPLQEEIISMSQRYYNVMALSVYKLLSTKAQETRIQINSTIALKNYWIARIALERSVGRSLPADICHCENCIGSP